MKDVVLVGCVIAIALAAWLLVAAWYVGGLC